MSEEYVKVVLTENNCTECAVEDIYFEEPSKFVLARELYSWEYGFEILAPRLEKWREVERAWHALQVELRELLTDTRRLEQAKRWRR